jgi:hypothetical protein
MLIVNDGKCKDLSISKNIALEAVKVPAGTETCTDAGIEEIFQEPIPFHTLLTVNIRFSSGTCGQ